MPPKDIEKPQNVLEFKLLSKQHRRSAFDCGSSALNQYLKTTARQHIQKGISKTFVAVQTETPKDIVGFFTLTMAEIDPTTFPLSLQKKLPTERVPVIKLARLAVAKQTQGQGFGEILL